MTSAAPIALLSFPFLLIATLAVVARHGAWLRGTTYREHPWPEWLERTFKLLMYIGLLGIAEVAWQVISGFYSVGALAVSDTCLVWFLFRHGLCLYWAAQGPLSHSTRDDSGWSDSGTRSYVWTFLATYVFGEVKVYLSEEWRDLSDKQRDKWQHEHYICGMHPHGLLPLGAILNGLTWSAGGLVGRTASGAELPEPKDAGPGLHQRWFPHMKLRAAVATGACGLFPPFYEMFRVLGAFDCAEPHVRARLREGKDVAIFPGGAAESAFAAPGRYVAAISKHHGFIRLALEERRNLLPLWCFGDEAIVPQMVNPPLILQRVQSFVKEVTGLLVPPLFSSLPQFPDLTLVAGVPVDLEDLWAAEPGDKVPPKAIEVALERYTQAQSNLILRNKDYVPGNHGSAKLEVK